MNKKLKKMGGHIYLISIFRIFEIFISFFSELFDDPAENWDIVTSVASVF